MEEDIFLNDKLNRKKLDKFGNNEKKSEYANSINEEKF